MKLRNLEWTRHCSSSFPPRAAVTTTPNRQNAMESWSIFPSAIICPSTTEFRKQHETTHSSVKNWAKRKMSCRSPRWWFFHFHDVFLLVPTWSSPFLSDKSQETKHQLCTHRRLILWLPKFWDIPRLTHTFHAQMFATDFFLSKALKLPCHTASRSSTDIPVLSFWLLGG